MDCPFNSEFESEVNRLTGIAAALEQYSTEIRTRGMSRDRAVALEGFHPGILEGHNVNAFTMHPSMNRALVACESIDKVRAGVIVTLITVAAVALYKLYVWIRDRISKVIARWGDRRIKQLTDGNLPSAVKLAGLNAKTEATRSARQEESTEFRYKCDPRIPKDYAARYFTTTNDRYAAALNPVIEVALLRAAEHNLPVSDTDAAVSELYALYRKLGPTKIAFLTLLANDVNTTAISEILALNAVAARRDEYNKTIRQDMYRATRANEVELIVNIITGIINRLTTLAEVTNKGDVANTGRMLQSLDMAIVNAVSDINRNGEHGAVRINSAQSTTGEFNRNEHGSRITPNDVFTVEQAESVSNLIVAINVARDERFGIWDCLNDSVRRPSTMIDWMTTLSDESTIAGIQKTVRVDVNGNLRQLKELTSRLNKLSTETEKLNKIVSHFGASKYHLTPYEYEIEGIVRVITPLEAVDRACKLVKDLSNAAQRQITSFIVVEESMIRYLEHLDRAVEICKTFDK